MKSEPTIRVVDDDQAVRGAIRALLESVHLTVETYASAEDFLERDDPGRPGCLVLDIRMPGASGLQLQDTLNARNIHIPIIFVTGHGDVPLTVRAMHAGAVDFLEKPFDDQALLDAIHRAVARDAQIRRDDAVRASILDMTAHLTKREREVLQLVVAGYSNKEIAARLGTVEKTVKVQRAHMMQKMQAESLPDLVRRAHTIGISGPIVQTDRG
jgi:two-component system, LuxR family, response regulator FixJ